MTPPEARAEKPKLTVKELNRLKELMERGNEDGDLPQDEMIETLKLLREAGITPMTLLGSLLSKSNNPSFRLLGEILA